MKQHFTGLQILRFVATMLVLGHAHHAGRLAFLERFFFRAPRLKYQNAGNTAPE